MFLNAISIIEKINLSKKITKSFIRRCDEINPFCASDWTFNLQFGKIQIISDNELYEEISTDTYVKKYLFNGRISIENNKIVGNYYYTSLGLVSEEDFMLAQDILEMHSQRIPKNELEKGAIYISDKGERVLYLGEVSISLFDYENNEYEQIILSKQKVVTDPYFYNLTKKSLVKSTSIKPILFEEINTQEYSICFDFFEQYYEPFIFIASTIENVSFYTDDVFYDLDELEELLSKNSSTDYVQQLEDFIHSDEETSLFGDKISNDVPYERNFSYNRRNNVYEHVDSNGAVSYYHSDEYGNVSIQNTIR